MRWINEGSSEMVGFRLEVAVIDVTGEKTVLSRKVEVKLSPNGNLRFHYWERFMELF